MTCLDCPYNHCVGLPLCEAAEYDLAQVERVLGIKRAREQVIHHTKVSSNIATFSPEGIFERSRCCGVEFEQLAPSKPKRLTKPNRRNLTC